LPDFQSSQSEFLKEKTKFSFRTVKVVEEVVQPKIRAETVEMNCRAKQFCQICPKIHSRRAGRAEHVIPRQMSKTDSMKFLAKKVEPSFSLRVGKSFQAEIPVWFGAISKNGKRRK